MKVKLYTIADQKANIFMPPMTAFNHADAQHKLLTSIIKDPQSQIAMYPEDYALCCIGEYDDSTGTIDALATPESLTNVNQLVEAHKEKQNDRKHTCN